jgi:hypothetical protein
MVSVMSKGIALLLVAGVTVGLVAAPPAAAKEAVKATLLAPLPLHAAAGMRIGVVWRLAYRDEHGRLQPFGGDGIFVRLRGATRKDVTSALGFGPTRSGRYTATIRVPRGGIRDVQFGIHGMSGGRRSDMLFTITNDPLPGAP